MIPLSPIVSSWDFVTTHHWTSLDILVIAYFSSVQKQITTSNETYFMYHLRLTKKKKMYYQVNRGNPEEVMFHRLKIKSGRPLESYSGWDSRPCGLIKKSNNPLIPPEITLNGIFPAGLCTSGPISLQSFLYTSTKWSLKNLPFKKYFMLPHYF